MEPVPFTFSRPVTSYGEQVTKIDLREPAGHEVRKLGVPLTFRDDGSVDFNMERVARYAEILSNPPLTPTAVNTIAPGDWLPLAGAMTPFFVPSTPKA